MRGNVAMHDFLETGFVDRNLAGLERIHFPRIVIDADNIVTHVSKTGARDEANITGTNN
jgi:hypothetical protein